MLIIRAIASCLLALTAAGTGVAFGQTYPNKPIRVLTSEAGATTDFAARLTAQGLSANLGQQVIVDNRPSRLIGEIVARAAPDGYTLLVASSSHWVGSLMRKTPYDPVKDFAPLAVISRTPHVLVVNPSVQVNSVKELIALAKAKPGGLNYSFSGIGGGNHLAGELFKSMAGVNFSNVIYKGGAAAINGLLTGEIHFSFPSSPSIQPFLKSGKVKPLAVTTAQASALLPGLPTVAASGLPGYEVVALSGAFAPAKTPKAIISRLNQEMVRVLNQADVKEKFFNSGAESVGGSPEEFAARIKSELATLGKIIRELGIKED